jgi:Uma2 family endonuclease
MENRAMGNPSVRAKLTYEDYLRIPYDGLQHEIIGGEHFVSAAPRPRHQIVAGKIFVALEAQIDARGRGRVLLPVDILFSSHDVVQPDITVVLTARRHLVGETKLDGAPDLVVEVLSGSTSARDRGIKMRLYESSGVPEYWIVDTVRRVLHQHVLEGGAYRLAGTHASRVEARTIDDLSVDLEPAWKAVEDLGHR